MNISSLSQGLRFTNDIGRLQTQMTDMNRQLVTGKKTDTFSGLGGDRGLILSLRSQLERTESFMETIKNIQLRIDITGKTLSRVDEIGNKLKTDSMTAGFKLLSSGRTQLQQLANANLDEMVAALNLELDDRFLFAGRNTDTLPVALPDLILDGDNTRAGLRTVIAERALADMGADNRGRLSLSVPAANVVQVAESDFPNTFGLKLSSTSSDLSGTTAGTPAGSPPAYTVAFSAVLPAAGEKASFAFILPDGTTQSITLTATTNAPPGEGEFTIGVDANTTAANFRSSFDNALQALSRTSLRAASAKVAADNFFDYDVNNPPQRVDGTPATATALRNATPADTVFWYQGDNSATPSRESVVGQIGDHQIVSYGTRADEAPVREIVKQAALLAAMQYSEADPHAETSYNALKTRVAGELTFSGSASVADVVTELGVSASMLKATRKRYESTMSISRGIVEDIENVEPFEAATKFRRLLIQLEGSYQITQRINQMSLTKFLR